MENIKIDNLYDLEKTIAKDIFKEVTYPWEVLAKISDFIIELGNSLDKNEFEKIGENIWAHKTCKIAKTAYENAVRVFSY